MVKQVLVDGDGFVYRAGFSVERTHYCVTSFDDGTFAEFLGADAAKHAAKPRDKIWSRREVGSLEDAIRNLNGMLKRAIEASGGSGDGPPFIYLSPTGGTFRDSIATVRKYKGNRDTHARPVYYPDLREYCVSTMGAMVAVGEEADDRISWTAREMQSQGKDVVIIGNDKDLVQIPGTHYNWEWNEIVTVTEDDAKIWFWCQVLGGDPGDNVPGCWKFGYAKAKYFITNCRGLSDEEVWPKVVKKYKESQKIAGCPYAGRDPEEVALETARLVRLKQKQKEPLWEPITKRENQDGKEAEARADTRGSKPRERSQGITKGTRGSGSAQSVSEAGHETEGA